MNKKNQEKGEKEEKIFVKSRKIAAGRKSGTRTWHSSFRSKQIRKIEGEKNKEKKKNVGKDQAKKKEIQEI